MKLFRSHFLRALVLTAFVAFHAAQTFHTHKASTTNDDCSVCQVVHHTPGVTASSSSALQNVFTFQSLLAVGGRIVVADRVSATALPRAPPVA